MTIKITKQQIKTAIEKSASMAEASVVVGIHFSTFKRSAEKFGLYTPNQGGKGTRKPKEDGAGKIALADILNGKEPQYQTFKLKHRLYAEGIKQNKCEECGIDSWNGKNIECELDHVDGNRSNHSLLNLKILCPNCHSQTSTFRFKKR